MLFRRHGFSALAAFGLAALICAGPAAAATAPGVARVSLLHGAVDLKRADSGDTVAATINAPFNPGDYLTTHEDARAEIEFGYDTALRLAPATDIRLVTLDPDHARVQLAAGTVELRLARGTNAHAEVETPQVTVRPTETGSYRISVASDGSTSVTARSGSADVVGDSSTQTVAAGTTLAFSGTPGNTAPTATSAANPDDFDRWNDKRDRTLAEAEAARSDSGYVDPSVVGADDLGTYGQWIENPRYGEVWSPYEGSSWSPYSNGQFVWEPYYGWTWVAAEPWGWAPYHYGNWFYAANSGWCWYPGAYNLAQPFAYRPAVVGFFSFGLGGGYGSGLSLGFGNIGWVPLAPYEAFNPWYGGYANNTVINNITNVTNVTNVYNGVGAYNGSGVYNVYHNLRAPGGAHGIDRHAFAVGNFARRIAPNRAALALAVPVRGIVPVVPTLASLSLVPGSKPVASAGNLGSRFAHFAPPAVHTPSFAATRAAVSAASATALAAMMPRANASVLRPAIVRNPRATAVPPAAVVRPAIPRNVLAAPVRLPTVIYLDGGPAATPRGATPVSRTPNAYRVRAVTPRAPSERFARGPATLSMSPASPWDRFASRTPAEFPGRRAETFRNEASPAFARPEPNVERFPRYNGPRYERVGPAHVGFTQAAPRAMSGYSFHESPHASVQVERSAPVMQHR